MDTLLRDTDPARCTNCKRRVDDVASFCHACAFPIVRQGQSRRYRLSPGGSSRFNPAAIGTLAAIATILAALRMPLPNLPGSHVHHVHYANHAMRNMPRAH